MFSKLPVLQNSSASWHDLSYPLLWSVTCHQCLHIYLGRYSSAIGFIRSVVPCTPFRYAMGLQTPYSTTSSGHLLQESEAFACDLGVSGSFPGEICFCASEPIPRSLALDMFEEVFRLPFSQTFASLPGRVCLHQVVSSHEVSVYGVSRSF